MTTTNPHSFRGGDIRASLASDISDVLVSCVNSVVPWSRPRRPVPNGGQTDRVGDDRVLAVAMVGGSVAG
jgi:hypothetical protein